MFDWKNSSKITILYYRNYSCGKFVSNVLGFNNNVVPQIPFTPNFRAYHTSVESLKTHDVFDNDVLREYKIRCIFKTIPPSIDECKKWVEYELGCEGFWNFNSFRLNVDEVNTTCIRLLQDEKICFIVAHNNSALLDLQSIFKNAKVIEIVNDDFVNKVSQQLKCQTARSIKSNVECVDSFKFDIMTMFDKDKFFENISKCFEFLEIEDQALDNRVYNYYNTYISLYNSFC